MFAQGWDTVLDEALASYPETMRTGTTVGGRRVRPGGFTSSDLNFKRQGMAQMWGLFLSRLDSNSGASSNLLDADKAALFTTKFFESIPKERYMFFVEDVDASMESTARNPLVGSYPYGRTGRTTRDPMQGFCHFKYSKRGKPVVRFIKPGKYTPFCPTNHGDVATPYEEQGSKLQRLSNGKYRHIASYSLDELIALGWDGAMYVSTKGRHAANGLYVPFVVGYDSDEDDTYEPINVQAGKRAGTIGLPSDEVGLYMAIPDMQNPGRRQMVQLNRGH